MYILEIYIFEQVLPCGRPESSAIKNKELFVILFLKSIIASLVNEMTHLLNSIYKLIKIFKRF